MLFSVCVHAVHGCVFGLANVVHPPGQFLQWVLFTTTRPHADRHRFTSAGRLQCSPFTLVLRNNPIREATISSPKYRFTYKAPWECLPQFSRFIISISLSHHLVRMANTHDHELRPSAQHYQITDNCHHTFCPAQNLH